MKKSIKESIEIALTLAIITGLFMPYVYGEIPIDFIFNQFTDCFGIIAVTIPIFITVPFLLILIFKDLLGNFILRALKAFFLILYLIVFLDYCYGIYDSLDSSFSEIFGIVSTIIISLILLILSVKFSVTKLDVLQNVLIAIMSFPYIMYFIFFIISGDNINYGGYIISISFISLYSITVYTIYKNRNIKKLIKKE